MKKKKKDNKSTKATGFELVNVTNNLPKKKETEGAVKVATGDARVAASKTTQVSEHVSVVELVTVDKTKFKKDYKPDIKEMSQKGATTEQIANVLGMSTSYANKLLKEPDKK